MDSVKSFKGYGKVDELEEHASRRKTRRRCIYLIVSTAILVAIIIGAVVGVLIHKSNRDSGNEAPLSTLSAEASLKAVCSLTQYPASCFSSISSLKSFNSTTDPEELFKLSLQIAIDEFAKLLDYSSKLISKTSDARLKKAISNCESLFDDAIDRLNESISAMSVKTGEKILSASKIDDLKTWLSTTITDQETCLDGLQELNYTLIEDAKSVMSNSAIFASNSLAIVAKIMGLLSDLEIPIHRKLLVAEEDGLPEWVNSGDRRLLREANPAPTVTVAKNGSGDVKTISEAVEKVLNKSKSRFVIHVKEGEYVENVILDKHKWNVMIYGDGKEKTIISGSLNFVDGTPTFSTATFAVAGRGFIAKDLSFHNTAGAAKHQAVAMRSGSDQSVFYRCSFNAFQDTLYAHSNRQFYRDCDITGTIDFIFGNAAVILQNCKIQPRQPLPNQFNTITAQGKKDPNQNTGIVIQKSVVTAFDRVSAPTYLGRPWKNFSTTVVMKSEIGAFLHSLGWIEWVAGVDPPASIFYAEFGNTGPGAALDQRVKWAGYKTNLTESEVAEFSVGTFIQGKDWLQQASVAFDDSLSNINHPK